MGEKMRLIKLAVFTLLLGVLAFPPSAFAQREAPRIIRDTEIELTLKEWMEPIFEAANMPPDSVKIILVQNDDINAFVAGGANIFLYTGLLIRTESPGEIIGVMAHELGHITGGHLINTRDALQRASYESILGTVLGIGAAIATGNGEAAAAISTGSSSIAQRRFLANSRVNEASADQAALTFMEKAEVNPTGLSTFMQKLRADELLPVDQQTEYIRTHPLTSNRIETLRRGLGDSAYKNKPLPENWKEQHARMKAKLIGFINPGRVLWVYSDNDQSIPARYARAIAAYRQNKIDKSLQLVDGLLEKEPDNPYFLELKGQILVDYARIDEAIPYYQKAVDMKPKASLIRMALGHALIESGDKENLPAAIKHLERVVKDEPRSSQSYRMLATAYGRQGDETTAKLFLAEEALLQNRIPYAKGLAEEVQKNAEENSREALQARDILSYVETRKDR